VLKFKREVSFVDFAPIHRYRSITAPVVIRVQFKIILIWIQFPSFPIIGRKHIISRNSNQSQHNASQRQKSNKSTTLIKKGSLALFPLITLRTAHISSFCKADHAGSGLNNVSNRSLDFFGGTHLNAKQIMGNRRDVPGWSVRVHRHFATSN
jgi:hypothetical protein